MEQLKAILKQKELLIRELEDYLWHHPEIEMQEFGAKEQFCRLLGNEGFMIDGNIPELPTAFKAWKGTGQGPHIAFVAEYDALPGIGHACGHNLIGSMAFGAAAALAERGLPGTVYLMGTPAEEAGRGKPGMIACGAFDGIDAAMMIHPNNSTALSSDMVNLEGYEIIFHGRASHAASAPEHGINALDALILFFNGIGLLRQQTDEASRIHAIITDGGLAPNIIPDRAALRVEVRHPRVPYFRELVERVLKIAEGAALSTGCTMERQIFEPPIACLKNNSVLKELFREHLLDSGLPASKINEKFITGGCTDMGNLSQAVPSIHPFLQMVSGDTLWHTKEFCDGVHKESALQEMMRGAQCLAGVGLDLLQTPDLVHQVWQEFHRQG